MGGAAKGLLEVGGRRILDRLVEAAVGAFGELPLLVANDPGAREWRPDLVAVPDAIPGAGALGGLYTAVVQAPAPVVCVAWDLPFIEAPFLRRLAEGLDAHDAFLPQSEGPRGLEPLCAAYGPGCAEPIRTAIARGDLRAIGFHPAVRVGVLDLVEVRRFGDPAKLFFNVNTTGDLAIAERLA
jgi:molybdopterin-guanine dinucleotide biosynthesis protein A